MEKCAVCRAAPPRRRKRRGGVHHQQQRAAPPHASVESITKNFASEVASSGIRICTVLQGADAAPEETADTAVFLAGADASYITGTAVEVGGRGEV